MTTLSKISPNSIHKSLVPIFAWNLENPTVEAIKDLHTKLRKESSNIKPGFFSKMTAVDYTSSVFSIIGVVASIFGFSKDESKVKTVGIGLILCGIGSFIYGIFNKIDLKNPSDNFTSRSKIDKSSLDTESISGLLEIVRNKDLEFYEREYACNKLHRDLSMSYSHEYNSYLAEIEGFNKTKNEIIADSKKKIERLAVNFTNLLDSKEQFMKNFSDMMNVANNDMLPTASRSLALTTTIELIKHNWMSVNPVSACVKETFRSLFKWIEESSLHPSEVDIMPVTIAMKEVEDLSETIKKNSMLSGHDLSKYDDFIPELESWLNSTDGNIKAAARAFFYHTKHPLGVKPLIESLKTYDPVQTTDRITRSDYRNLITKIIKRILKEAATGQGLGLNIKASLENDLYNYLDNENNDIVMVASRLVDPKDEEVRTKLLGLFEREDIILKWELLEILGDYREQSDVNNKLSEILKDDKEEPFIRYIIGEILELPRKGLLVDSLESKCPEVVNFAALKLFGTKNKSVIEPLKNAGRTGSIEAMFTLNKMAVDGIERDDTNAFLRAELPRFLNKYSETHTNYTRINRILEAIGSVEATEAISIKSEV